MKQRINQVRLLVRDFPAVFRFYRDVMGLPVGSGSEDEVYADFQLDNSQTLGLFRRDLMAQIVGADSKPAQDNAQDSSLLVFEVDDVDQVVQSFQGNGVSFITTMPTDRPEWGMRTAHFRDPDGNLLEIFHPLPMS